MTKPMPKPLPLQNRVGVTLLASLAGLALGTFVAALATIAALAIFQTQLIAPDRAVLVLKVVPVAFVLGALMLHRWLWAEYVDSRVSAIAAA